MCLMKFVFLKSKFVKLGDQASRRGELCNRIGLYSVGFIMLNKYLILIKARISNGLNICRYYRPFQPSNEMY